VEAEVLGLREAVQCTRAEHVAVLSGSDYPLLPIEELLDTLRPWQGLSYFTNMPLPFREWDTPRHRDGGQWRVRYRFLTRGHQLVHWGGVPLRFPIRRAVPEGVELRASTQWKIYAREHAQILLRIVDTRPDLIRFWRSTLVPDETFAASVLGSPSLAGSAALRPCRANAWLIDFPPGATHPRWLSSADFTRIARARRAPPATPDVAFRESAVPTPEHRKLFARKFSSEVASGVLERIDSELRR
jgi:hypothetical protein